nr:PH domain-containing protein [Pseudoclavibacter chungangensis]
MLTYRVTDDVVELREGLIRRRHRQARLDRIQSINVVRPALARLFGAVVLDIEGAGDGTGIKLQYVRASEADELRAEILERASGARVRSSAARPAPLADGDEGARDTATGGGTGAIGGDLTPTAHAPARGSLSDLISSRVDDLVHADDIANEPSTLVQLSKGRLVGTVLVDLVVTAFFVGLVVVFVVAVPMAIARIVLGPESDLAVPSWLPFVLLGFLPPLFFVCIGSIAGRLIPFLRYDIHGTVDGVRLVRGLFTTTTETLPPGRIHAIEVRQPLLWRPFGWWEVRVTRAGGQAPAAQSSGQRQAQLRNVVLPVGTRDDVQRVIALFLPTRVGAGAERMIDDGLVKPAQGDGYVPAPRRARWTHPFSFRRIGHVLATDVFAVRTGALTRRLAIVPLERVQSIRAVQGPIQNWFRLAAVAPDTVAGVVDTRVPAVDARQAVQLLDRLAAAAIAAAAHDSSHRWAELSARSAVVSARLRIADAAERGVAPDRRSVAIMAAADEFRATRDGRTASDATPPPAGPVPWPDVHGGPVQGGPAHERPANGEGGTT